MWGTLNLEKITLAALFATYLTTVGATLIIFAPRLALDSSWEWELLWPELSHRTQIRYSVRITYL